MEFFVLSILLLHSINLVSSRALTPSNESPIGVKGFDPYPCQKYEVHIINNLNGTSPLLVHCKSKDDDLGARTLRTKDEVKWRFGVNLWLTTLYYCRFRWGGKDITFDVFNKHIAPYCVPYNEKGGNFCVWVVREDGFWISSQLPPITLEQLHKWP